MWCSFRGIFQPGQQAVGAEALGTRNVLRWKGEEGPKRNELSAPFCLSGSVRATVLSGDPVTRGLSRVSDGPAEGRRVTPLSPSANHPSLYRRFLGLTFQGHPSVAGVSMPSCSVPSNLPLCGHWAVSLDPPRAGLSSGHHRAPRNTGGNFSNVHTKSRGEQEPATEPQRQTGEKALLGTATCGPSAGLSGCGSAFYPQSLSYPSPAHSVPPVKVQRTPGPWTCALTAAEVTPGTNEQRGHGHWGHPETRRGQRSDSYLFKKTSTQTLCPPLPRGEGGCRQRLSLAVRVPSARSVLRGGDGCHKAGAS